MSIWLYIRFHNENSIIFLKGVEENDLQTEADRSAQRCIVASLSKQFPDVTIIGEEGALNGIDEVIIDVVG